MVPVTTTTNARTGTATTKETGTVSYASQLLRVLTLEPELPDQTSRASSSQLEEQARGLKLRARSLTTSTTALA